jgi:hypothetical protein
MIVALVAFHVVLQLGVLSVQRVTIWTKLICDSNRETLDPFNTSLASLILCMSDDR